MNLPASIQTKRFVTSHNHSFINNIKTPLNSNYPKDVYALYFFRDSQCRHWRQSNFSGLFFRGLQEMASWDKNFRAQGLGPIFPISDWSRIGIETGASFSLHHKKILLEEHFCRENREFRISRLEWKSRTLSLKKKTTIIQLKFFHLTYVKHWF